MLAGVKTGIRPLDAALSSIRPRPNFAAAADSYRLDAEMYSVRGPLKAMPDGLVTALEYL
jgi:hypothetical protein